MPGVVAANFLNLEMVSCDGIREAGLAAWETNLKVDGVPAAPLTSSPGGRRLGPFFGRRAASGLAVLPVPSHQKGKGFGAGTSL